MHKDWLTVSGMAKILNQDFPVDTKFINFRKRL